MLPPRLIALSVFGLGLAAALTPGSAAAGHDLLHSGATCGTPDRVITLAEDAIFGPLRPSEAALAKAGPGVIPCDDNPRPTYPNEQVFTDDEYGFTIHYTLDTSSDAVVTEDDVARLAEVLRDSMDVIQIDMGFLSPPDDTIDGETYCDEGFGGNGGSGYFDIYFIADDDLYGYAQPMTDIEGPGFAATSFLALSTWIFDSEGALEVTVAHEFFHSVQFAYDSWEDAAWMESSATWMEEQVYDDVNDYVGYLEDAFDAPELPLDTFQDRGVLQYGNVIFPLFVTERLPQSFIYDVWVGAAEVQGENFLPVVRDLLDVRYEGGYAKAILDFRSAMVDTSKFSEGDLFPDVARWDYDLIQGSGKVEYSAAHIIDLLPPESPDTLAVCFDSEEPETMARLLAIGADGMVSVVGDLAAGEVLSVDDVGGAVSTLTLVISQGTIDGKGSYDYGTATTEEGTCEPGGCGCASSDSGAAGGLGSLLLMGLIGLGRRRQIRLSA